MLRQLAILLAALIPAVPLTTYSLVALDMDGTAFNAQHRLSDRTVRTLRKLREDGTIVSLCSGRSQVAMADAVAQLSIEDMPIVCFNGALGIRCAGSGSGSVAAGETLFQRPVGAQAAAAVLELAEAHGLLVQYYVGDQIYVASKTDAHIELAQRYATLTGVAAHVHVEDYCAATALGPSAKLLVLTDDVDGVYALLDRELPRGLVKLVRGSPPFFVEVLHPEVNKGVGLEALCAQLGVPLSRVVAFGDGDNDIEFLQCAGMGLAMANARDVLKEVADAVTASPHDEDGVAVELDRLRAEGRL